MLEGGIEGLALADILAGASVLGASLLIAWLSSLFLGRTAKRLAGLFQGKL